MTDAELAQLIGSASFFIGGQIQIINLYPRISGQITVFGPVTESFRIVDATIVFPCTTRYFRPRERADWTARTYGELILLNDFRYVRIQILPSRRTKLWFESQGFIVILFPPNASGPETFAGPPWDVECTPVDIATIAQRGRPAPHLRLVPQP